MGDGVPGVQRHNRSVLILLLLLLLLLQAVFVINKHICQGRRRVGALLLRRFRKTIEKSRFEDGLGLRRLRDKESEE